MEASAFTPPPLSSAEASLYCGEAFVLWGGWGERKRERAGPPARFLFLSIIDILMGIPSGSLCGGESPSANLALTTASLKWRLGAWSIQGLPLLTASPLIEIMRP